MKIRLMRSWEKQEEERCRDMENLRTIQVAERDVIKELTGITKIPLRWTSKKAHLIVKVV